MLKMSGQAVVRCAYGPAILLNSHLMSPRVDHRLDRQDHTSTELWAPIALGKVRDFGGLVQGAATSVANKISDGGEAGIEDDPLHGSTDVIDITAATRCRDPGFKALLCRVHQGCGDGA